MEREAEHVRMLDVGRLRARYAALSDGAFASAPSTKFQLMQHGDAFGLTFVASESGFVVTKQDALEAATTDYVKRRQAAVDHGEKLGSDEIHAVPVEREIELRAPAYVIALSPDELHVAVAHGESVSLFEVAALLQSDEPRAFDTFPGLSAQEIAWCPDTASPSLAVLTGDKRVVVCTLNGSQRVVRDGSTASSVCWSASGDGLAVGTTHATVDVYSCESFALSHTVPRPDCCDDDGFEAHHVNWVEDDLMLIGYQKYEDEDTTALACLFEKGEWVNLDELVAYFDVEGRRHQYYSVYLPDWRMFFVGCSLSSDIELLVWDPEEEEWLIWKPSEKYQARIPMNSEDEDTYPMGMALNLNAIEVVQVDDSSYPPAPVLTCATSEGLVISFAFIDTTVYEELEFVKGPEQFSAQISRASLPVGAPTDAVNKKTTGGSDINEGRGGGSAPKKDTTNDGYGQNDENTFADESDSDDDDDEEERKEEEESARTAFQSLLSNGETAIELGQVPKLFKTLGATYCEEDLAGKMEKLATDGKIDEDDFAKWYVDWIFGDESDEEEDGDDKAPSGVKEEKSDMKSDAEISAAFGKFKPVEGSWKCAVCMVSNGPDALKCSACETPNPNAPKSLAPAKSTTPSAPGGIGAGGFSFPVASSGTSTSGASGFSFGVPSSSTSTSGEGSKPAGGFSFGFSAPSASATPSSGGFSFTGFTDSQTTSQDKKPADQPLNKEGRDGSSAPKKDTTNDGYGQNDENTFADESDSDDDDDEEERKEEEESARTAFQSLLSNGETAIELGQVPKLFKTLGATYCEEDLAGKMEKLATDGKIDEDDFAKWYVDWIFGDESDEEEDGDDKAPSGVKEEKSDMKSDAEISAAFGKFKPVEGSWKCAVCMVSNGPDALKCSACETPNPNAPKSLAPAKSTTPSAPGGIGAGGFSFPVASSGTSTSGASGFSFGVPSSSTSTSGEGSKPAGGFSFGFSAPSASTAPSSGGFSFSGFAKPSAESKTAAATSSSAYPPDTSSKPKPSPVGGAAAGGAYPPDTSTKPKPPTFGYPPDTTAKPKPPVFGGGAASGGYPPDTTTKPKPPAFGYPPDTTAKPAPPVFGGAAGSGAYPPDTTTKPKPPAFGGGAASGGYPPDTTTKPKPPAFGSAASGGYPPDTSTKPKPPAFGYPPDTSTKPKPPVFGASTSSGGYPPDTSTKPKPPVFGGAATGGYPPDTSTKPKPPVFGASASSGGYPPDTSTKPKPPVFGAAASGGYPPDTSTKAKLPAFGIAAGAASSSTAKPIAFGTSGSTAADGTKSAFSFSSFGKTLQKDEPSSSTPSASSSSAPRPFGSPASGSRFASSFGTTTLDKSAHSPFGVVPKLPPASSFSLPPPAAGAKETHEKADKKRVSFELPSGAASATSVKPSSTQRKLQFGEERSSDDAATKTAVATTSVGGEKAIPKSAFEGQLWKLIAEFDQSLRHVKSKTAGIKSKDEKYSAPFESKLGELRTSIAALCDEITALDLSRSEIEKDVLFVIGSNGDIHEQLEYGREILASYKDEALKKSLEEQPLDQRSLDTRESLKDKFDEVEKCCVDLERHLASAGNDGVPGTTALFRVLKQTYENSKLQYNKVCLLAEQIDKLSMRDERLVQSKAMISGARPSKMVANPRLSKEDMAEVLLDSETRCQSVRQHFLALCNNTVTPRDVFPAPRVKAAKAAQASTVSSNTSPLRIKAYSKLMPKTQLTVASPLSSAKTASGSISFKEPPVKSGSRLFALAEEMTPKQPATFIATPQPAKPAAPVSTKRRNMASITTVTPQQADDVPATKSSSGFNFARPSLPASGSSAATRSAPVSTGGSTATKPTEPSVLDKGGPQSPFVLGGKETPSKFGGWPTKSDGEKKPTTSSSAVGAGAPAQPDYKSLLTKFYQEHNAAKVAQVDKLLKDFAGRERSMFSRLFTQYVPNSSEEDVDKYLKGGSVPKKQQVAKPAATASSTPTGSGTPFGASGAFTTSSSTTSAKPSPFGTTPTTTGSTSTTSSGFGFGGFGSALQATNTPTATASTPSSSPFGAVGAVDYRQKLVDFYQKHNPSKLSSVDATLAKYKGNEEKLFQNLATKYQVAVGGVSGGAIAQPPTTPVLQSVKANPSASPFGNANSFASIAKTPGSPSPFGTATTGGFGSTALPSTSPFGAATTATTSAFGTPASSPSPFGAAKPTPAFGTGFQSGGASPGAAFGASSQLGTGFGAAGSVNHRERLVAFYQQYNPEKLNSVDATLVKYKGQEERLFAMLEQKYLKKQPAAGGFGGIPSTTSFGGGFGAPSALGQGSATPAFGSASTFGGAAQQPAFGATSTPAFGGASQLGGGGFSGAAGAFAASTPVGAAASGQGSGFSSFSAQGPSFSSGGFGGGGSSGFGASPGGGFGGSPGGGFGGSPSSGFGGGNPGFGSGASTGFGQPASFSSASFTQMR